MTVTNETAQPQRRVGTFTFGVTLVAAGAGMLAAMFVPSITPEVLFQASPAILVLLGLEVLLSARKGGKLRYDWLGMILCFVLTGAALSMYMVSWYLSEDGPGISRVSSRYADDVSYEMEFQNFSGHDAHVLHLQSGGVLRAAFTLYRGSVDMEVSDAEGNTLSENTVYSGGAAWERLIEIPAGGEYWVQVDGNYGTGSFLFETVEPEAAEPSDSAEPPAPVETSIP